jgi:tetratricopeptide (TPR) repeat protein
LKINESCYYTLNNKGFALNGLGEFEKALENINKSIKINPYRAATHKNKGVSLSGLSRSEEVLIEFDLVIDWIIICLKLIIRIIKDREE